MTEFCKRPDRQEPRLKCGYPLPCPYHTIEVNGIDRAVGLVKKFGGLKELHKEEQKG